MISVSSGSHRSYDFRLLSATHIHALPDGEAIRAVLWKRNQNGFSYDVLIVNTLLGEDAICLQYQLNRLFQIHTCFFEGWSLCICAGEFFNKSDIALWDFLKDSGQLNAHGMNSLCSPVTPDDIRSNGFQEITVVKTILISKCNHLAQGVQEKIRTPERMTHAYVMPDTFFLASMRSSPHI